MLWKSQGQTPRRDRTLSVSNRTTSARLGAYLTLIRPPNTIMIGLGVVIGEAIALGVLPGIREAVFGFLTASLMRSEEHTSELQSPDHLVCRLLLEKKKK